jgi:hypothetical protein
MKRLYTNLINNHILVLSILIIVIYRLFYFKFGIYTILYNSDTITYFTKNNLLNLKIDLYRTPIYPFILSVFESISIEHFIRNLILFQHFIAFICLPFLFISIQNSTENKWLAAITTIIFGCNHLVLDQIKNINPESIAISGSIFLIFIISYNIKNPTKWNAVLIGLSPFVFIMLKPNFIILYPIILLFVIILFIENSVDRKNVIAISCSWLFSCLFLFGYCMTNKQINNEFTLSKIALNNSISNIAKSGAYKLGRDSELISIVDKTRNIGYYKYYTTVFTINNEYIDKFKIYIKNKVLKKYPPTGDIEFYLKISDTKNYSADRIKKFVNHSQKSKIFILYVLKRMVGIFYLKPFLLFIMIIQLIVNVYSYLKEKKIDWILFLSITYIFSTYITLAINGINDWERVLLPCYPFIALIYAYFASMLKQLLLINRRFNKWF